MTHLLISNDCPYVTASQFRELIRWYASRSTSLITILCPHLDANTELGESQTRYIYDVMKSQHYGSHIELVIETDIERGLANAKDVETIVYMYYGPSYLYNPYTNNSFTLGMEVNNAFMTEDYKATHGKIPRSYSFPVARSESKEAIVFLGDRYLEYCDEFVKNPHALYAAATARKKQ